MSQTFDEIKDIINNLEKKVKDLYRDNRNQTIINNGYEIEQDKILEFISNELQIKYINQRSLDIGYQYYLDQFKSAIQKMKDENEKKDIQIKELKNEEKDVGMMISEWTVERSSYQRDIIDLKDKVYKLENKKDLEEIKIN
jgi:hypothetical protein